MKNIFRLFAVVAMVAALATSCSKTEENPVTPPTPPTPSGDITPGTLEIRFRCGGDLTNIANMDIKLVNNGKTISLTQDDLVAQSSTYTDPASGVVYNFNHELTLTMDVATLPASFAYRIIFTAKEGIDTESTTKYDVIRALGFTYKDKNGKEVAISNRDMGISKGVHGDKLDQMCQTLNRIYNRESEYTILENGKVE